MFLETKTSLDNQKTSEAPSRLRILYLLGLSGNQERELKESILNQGGIVDIFVHPSCEETDPISGQTPAPEYLQKRDLFIIRTLTDGKPLIIFEEQSELLKLEERISGISKDTLYVVATGFGSTPIIPGREILVYHPTHNNIKAAWSFLVEVLKRIGVNGANIGGRYLFLHPAEEGQEVQELSLLKKLAKDKPSANEWLGRNILPMGCVGTTARELLERGIDVAFSPISSPDVFVSEM